MGVRDRIAHAWNAFVDADRDVPHPFSGGSGGGYSTRPDRPRMNASNERTIISAIYTRIGVDVASAIIRHIRKDDSGRYLETIKSGLNYCFTEEANIDQAASAFRQDLVMSLLDKGVVAVVPIITTANPERTGGYDITNLRVGEVVQWYPEHVLVSVYDERIGRRREIKLSKKFVAIIENPLYSVMNEPNSTLKRIIRKLNLLDAIDEATGSGKLDILIKLPYTIKSEARQQQADKRRQEIETQLKGSKYGIAYVDSTESITQLNRPAENNMLSQIEFLLNRLYGELGLAESVFLGTANEETMLNYHVRTIEPMLRAIIEELNRKFLTKTARTQGQTMEFTRDPFKLVPLSQIAEIGDKLTRNEILTSNELRQILGFAPKEDVSADRLVNKNLPHEVGEDGAPGVPGESGEVNTDFESEAEEIFGALEADIERILKDNENA